MMAANMIAAMGIIGILIVVLGARRPRWVMFGVVVSQIMAAAEWWPLSSLVVLVALLVSEGDL